MTPRRPPDTLFPYAEAAKDNIEDIVDTDDADQFTQCVSGRTDMRGRNRDW